MSFCLSFHQALPGPTGAHWLDDPSDVSCKDSTRQHSYRQPSPVPSGRTSGSQSACLRTYRRQEPQTIDGADS